LPAGGTILPAVSQNTGRCHKCNKVLPIKD
jgi:hypothetical protein